MTIKISNLHSKIRLSHIYRIFSYFGEITEVGITEETDNSYYLKYSNEVSENNSLVLNKYLITKKPIEIRKVNYKNLVPINISRIILVENFFGSADELVSEIQKYGNISKIEFNKNRFEIICKDFKDAKNIFLNIFGRWYDNRKIKCFFK